MARFHCIVCTYYTIYYDYSGYKNLCTNIRMFTRLVLLCIYIVDLEYVSMVWGDREVTLLCPPGGTEPFLAIPELVDKVSSARQNQLYMILIKNLCICTDLSQPDIC